MKKISIVTRSMYAGGAERVIAQLANYFATNNYECFIVTIDNEKVLYELNKNIRLIPIGKKSAGKLIDKFLRYKNLRRIIQEEKPDIVLSLPEDIGIYVVLALIGTSIPVYVSERNNPWIMPDKKITRMLRKVAYPFAKGIIFQTEMAKSFFPRFIQNKGVIIDNPIDADRIPFQYIGKRNKIIVSAGRLDSQKNFPLLIQAFSDFIKNYPDYKLVIYGEGEKRNNLINQIQNLGLDEKISLPGRKNNLLELMNPCAMFILTSDYEGMPNVLLEAMCMGMPVISTDCPSGGPKELINNGVNGLLIPVGCVSNLVEAMELLVDEKYAGKLANNAYKIRDAKTSIEVFKKWEEFLIR